MRWPVRGLVQLAYKLSTSPAVLVSWLLDCARCEGNRFDNSRTWSIDHLGFRARWVQWLELLIEETNTKSKAVAERTGYVCEGVLAKKVWKHGDHRTSRSTPERSESSVLQNKGSGSETDTHRFGAREKYVKR